MELFDFGNSNLKISRIGLGMAALGRPGYINLGHANDFTDNNSVSGMRERSNHMLDFAYDHGIRYFDVARSYGKGEEFLASWLKTNKNLNDVVVGSKWGYTYTADWTINTDTHEVKDHSLEVLKRQWKESLLTFEKTPNIYHIHSATLESGVLFNNEVLKELWQIKEQGVLIGLSLSGAGQSDALTAAMNVKKGNIHLFSSVQATWNIFETSAGSSLKKASDSGWGVIIKEVVANGRLTARNKNMDPGSRKKLQNMADRYDVGIDAIAIAFALAQNWISIVLSGASTEKQLVSNLDALKIQLNSGDLEELSTLKEEPLQYWETRSALDWN